MEASTDGYEPNHNAGPGHAFRDRVHAGRLLGAHLAAYRGKGAIVLGIPRGGVPVAIEVARSLDADADVIVARKLGTPGAPELAIGAVTANGGRFLNQDLVREFSIPEAYVEMVTARERAEAQRREIRFRDQRAPVSVSGRVVIVVDDGLATGATMRAAVRALRKHDPAKVVVAVPVGSPEACGVLRAEADEVICPYVPVSFFAVGQFYDHFEPVEDEEVARLLADWHAAREAKRRHGPPQAA